MILGELPYIWANDDNEIFTKSKDILFKNSDNSTFVGQGTNGKSGFIDF